MTEDDYLARTRFVSKLGLSLHACGATSQRIECHLLNLCELLGIRGSFLYAPTSFTFCYWLDDPNEQTIQVERLQPSQGDLGRLERLDALVTRFESNELPFAEMCEVFESETAPLHYYSKPFQCLAWVVLSASFACLFSSQLVDGLAAGFISSLVFLLAQIAGESKRFAPTLEVLVAIVSGVIATGVAAVGIGINVPLVLLSTVIVFIPGLSLTVALSEIAERDLVSGTSKLVDAVMCLFKLYLGALLGLGLGEIFWPSIPEPIDLGLASLPDWKTLPLIALLSLTLSTAFNIRLKLAPWCIISALIGFTIAQWASGAFGTVAGMFLGAFSVGVYANWFSNKLNKPVSIVLIQGLIVLVPGSKSYMILNTWVTGEQILSDGASINEAFLTFISLVVGLLLANAVLPSRKSL